MCLYIDITLVFVVFLRYPKLILTTFVYLIIKWFSTHFSFLINPFRCMEPESRFYPVFNNFIIFIPYTLQMFWKEKILIKWRKRAKEKTPEKIFRYFQTSVVDVYGQSAVLLCVLDCSCLQLRPVNIDDPNGCVTCLSTRKKQRKRVHIDKCTRHRVCSERQIDL